MTKIIGINGFKRSGKGATGNAITDVGYDYMKTTTQLGFADKLKILAAKSLGFVDRDDSWCIALMDTAKEKWVFEIYNESIEVAPGDVRPAHPLAPWHNLTGREFLQNLGNEARGVFGADFWVDQVLPGGVNPFIELERKYPGVDCLVLTDLRYPNEAQRVQALGGEVWEVIRPGLASDGHASEQVLPRNLVTRQIDNSGPLEALRFEVEKALGL